MYKTILINRENKIKDNFLKRIELITTKNIENKESLVEKDTHQAFLELKKFLKTHINLF